MKYIKLSKDAFMPVYESAEDSGLTIFASRLHTLYVNHGTYVHTDLILSAPNRFIGFLRPHPLISKNRITIIDTGVVESNSALLIVKMHNLGTMKYDIKVGDPIAKLYVVPVYRPALEEFDATI